MPKFRRLSAGPPGPRLPNPFCAMKCGPGMMASRCAPIFGAGFRKETPGGFSWTQKQATPLEIYTFLQSCSHTECLSVPVWKDDSKLKDVHLRCLSLICLLNFIQSGYQWCKLSVNFFSFLSYSWEFYFLYRIWDWNLWDDSHLTIFKTDFSR